MTSETPVGAKPISVGAEADAPPESRGDARDSVRLMVSLPGARPLHSRFVDLPGFLDPGDLVVINTSATWPAALDTRLDDGAPLRVHVAGRLPDGSWLVEARLPGGPANQPFGGDLTGVSLPLAESGAIDIQGRFRGSARLWASRVRVPGDLAGYLARWGRPIRYAYVTAEWPIEAYQTVYATTPGSAEMPSAGRPFSANVITAMVARGIAFAPLLLHTGVSSLEGAEAPYPEWYSVPAETARQVNQARAAGRRVVAVGTTVVRALESAAGNAGSVAEVSGWTDLLITPESGVRVVDALLTGFHDPRASHLRMLQAMAPMTVLRDAYEAARDGGYRWHEFGDSHLILRHD